MSAVGNEGNSTQVILGILIYACVKYDSFTDHSSLAEREVLKYLFLVASFTTDCIDRINDKKTGERRVGNCTGNFLEFA
jgi:hypothetical protein